MSCSWFGYKKSWQNGSYSNLKARTPRGCLRLQFAKLSLWRKEQTSDGRAPITLWDNLLSPPCNIKARFQNKQCISPTPVISDQIIQVFFGSIDGRHLYDAAIKTQGDWHLDVGWWRWWEGICIHTLIYHERGRNTWITYRLCNPVSSSFTYIWMFGVFGHLCSPFHELSLYSAPPIPPHLRNRNVEVRQWHRVIFNRNFSGTLYYTKTS